MKKTTLRQAALKLALVAVALLAPLGLRAQSLAEYTFSTGTDASQWITLSDGATSIVSTGDDTYSSLTDIGFSFPFGEESYTKFWANANGIFSFSSSPANSYYSQFNNSSNLSANQPKICGITRDLYCPSGGYVKYELTGTAPNRVLVCEFKLNNTSSSGTNYIMWQVQLHESNSSVVIVYGTAVAAPSSFQIGLSQSTSDICLVNPSTHEVTRATTYNSTTYSSWPGANRYYSFARPVITCPKPTGLAATLTPGNGTIATLNWTKGGSETAWVLEYATNNTFTSGRVEVTDPLRFTVVGSTVSVDLSSLTAETPYFARVKADCGGGDESDWSNVISFTPTAAYCTEIGSGATASSGGAYCGIYTYNNYYAYTQQLYTASELTTAGAIPGVVRNISLRYAEDDNSNLTFEVYLGQTTGTSLSSAWISDADLTKVYDGTTTFSGNGEWNSINTTAITEWEWDGTSNIVVAIRRTDKSTPAVTYPDFYKTTSSGMCRYITSSSSNITLDANNVPSSAGSTASQRSEIKFCITPNPTPKPKDLTVTALSASSATLQWVAPSNATPTGYQYRYKAGDDEYTDWTSNETNLSVTLSTLSSSTLHTFQVKAIYDGVGESDAIETTFTTLDACAFPTALTASVTPGLGTRATLSWTKGYDETAWVLEYSTNPDFSSATQVTTGFTTEGTTVSVNLTGLTAEQTYYAHVKAKCSETSSSSWTSEPVAFTPTYYTDYTYGNSASYTTSNVPFYGYRANYGTYSQFIIPAENLTDVADGTIRRMTFYSSNASVSWGAAIFKVYMKEVDYTAFSAASADALEAWDGMDNVYSGSLSVSDNKMVIDFDDDYTYNGGNLLIGFNETTLGTGNSVSWYYVTGQSNATLYASKPSGSGDFNHGRSTYLPKVTFNYRITPYQRVAEINEGTITTTTAQLTWAAPATESTITGYAYQYKKASEEAWSDWANLSASTTSVTLESLTSGTIYDFRIKVIYEGNHESAITSTSFQTECAAVTVTDGSHYTENFDGMTASSAYTPTEYVMPICWNLINNCTYSSYMYYPVVSSYGSNSHSGTNYLRLYSVYSSNSSYDPQPQYAILPEMDNLDGMRIKLWAQGYNATSTFKIGRMTDPTDVSTFEAFEISTGVYEQALTTSYQEFTYNIDGTGDYLAIMIDAANSSRTYNGVYIDDILVEPIPSCLEPSDLEFVSSTTNSATLGWTAVGTETAWDIYVSTENVAPTNSTAPTVSATTDNPATVSGLTASTTYYAWVRAHCDDGDGQQSPWVGGISFATECEAVTSFPWSENFESFAANTNTGYGETYKVNALCWLNEHLLDGTGSSGTMTLFQVCSNTQTGNSTNKLQLPDMMSGTQTLLRLPEMNLPNSNYQFTIDVYRNTSGSYYTSEGVRVFASQDGDIEGATELGFLYRNCNQTDDNIVPDEGSTGWYTYEFPIPFSGTCYIILRGESQYGSSTYLDNLIVEQVPTCRKPKDPSCTATTAHTATLSWTNGAASQNAWQIAYSTSNSFAPAANFTPGEGEGLANVTTNPATIENLAQSTTYYAYVRANCGGGDYSAWNTTKVTFTTLAGNVTPTGLAVAANTITSSQATASWNAVAGNTLHQSYDIYWAEATVTAVPDEPAAPNYISGFTETSQVIAGLAAETNYKVWVRDNCGTDGYSNWSSPVTFATAASCQTPDGLAASNVTNNSATISWNTYGQTGFNLRYSTDGENWITTNEPVNTPYILGVLDGNTAYQVQVQATCDNETWSTVLNFTTECNAITIPNEGWTENFDGLSVASAYTAPSARVLPTCWKAINTTTYNTYKPFPTAYYYSSTNYAHSTPNCLKFYSYYSSFNDSYDPQPQYAILPEMDNLGGKQITLFAKGYNSNSTLKVGRMTNPSDASTFSLIQELTLTTSYQEYYVELTGTGNYIALMIDAATSSRDVNGAYVDDITIADIPTCRKPSDLEVTSTVRSATCTWVSEVGNYDIVHATDATANPDNENIAGTATDTTFTMNNLEFGDHYFWVRANCGNSDYSEWVGPVGVYIGYCLPAPSSVDGDGITNVTFGTGDYVVNNITHPTASPYYGDYTAQIGAVQAGVESTIDIEYSTGYTYDTYVWVDWNNDLTFDASEVLCYGVSSNVSPTTLTLTFTVPAVQAIGDYRMRIGGADSGLGTDPDGANPCYTGSYGVFEDYALRVLEAPSCLPAADVAVASGSVTAAISWTNNNGEDATYTVMQGETVLTTTAISSYALTGLTAATTYPAGTYTIISNCNETLVVNVPAFTTKCEAITSFPWSETFDELTEASSIPDCWDNSEGTTTNDSYKWCYNTSTSGNGATNGTGHTGNCVRFNSFSNGSSSVHPTNFLKTPVMNFPVGQTMQLSFWYKNPSGGDFSVYISTDGGSTYTTSLATGLTGQTSWKEQNIVLSDYVGTEDVVIVFKGTSNWGNGDAYIYLDDVTVEEYHVEKAILANKWYAISSPVHNSDNDETLAGVTNLIPTDAEFAFDFYRYDEANGTWKNYKANSFDLEQGRGYIYRRSNDATLSFVGTPNTNSGDISYDLSYACSDNDLKGFNLVGNPYPQAATPDMACYSLTPAGLWSAHETYSAAVCEAVLVHTSGTGNSVSFSTGGGAKGSYDNAALAFTVSNEEFEDVTYAMLDNGDGLPKIGHIATNAPELSIPVAGRRYAIATLGAEAECFELNFRGIGGEYTLTLNAQRSTLNYCHLIDRATNKDIDLLGQPTYTFNATGSDGSRFLVKLKPDAETVNTTFAIWNGEAWVVNGNGTLQVFDVLGRQLLRQDIQGSEYRIQNTQFPGSGVYILRLGEKSQKIVVK